MQLPNWVEGAVAYHAVARLGAVMVPVIMDYRQSELRRILSNSCAGNLQPMSWASILRAMSQLA